MEKKKSKYRWLRRTGRVFLVLLLLFVGLVLFVRSPWGQDIIVNKLVGSISEKTGTKVEIDRLFITFSGNIYLEGLYLEDKQGDTLAYSRSLEANLPLYPVLFQNKIDLESVDWDGLIANISRAENTEKFNFSFLLDAYTINDSTATTDQSESMEIVLGEIDLSDFKIQYKDEFLGTESSLRLGHLYADMDYFDLEDMRFELDEAELNDTQIDFKQTKPLPAEEDSTETKLPFLKIDELSIHNVKANYNSVPDELRANIILGDFELEMPKADLAKNDFEVDKIALMNSDVHLQILGQEETVDQVEVSQPFEWPELLLDLEEINLKNNNIGYRTGNSQNKNEQFNLEDLEMMNLNLNAKNILYRSKEATATVSNFSFNEKSGFQLQNLLFSARLENTSASVSGLEVETANSSVSGNMNMEFLSVDQMIKNPSNTKVNVDFPRFELSLKDAFFFQPDLTKNTYVKTAAKDRFSGNLMAEGTLEAINLPHFHLEWGGSTFTDLQGEIRNISKPDSLFMDLGTVELVTTKADVLRFISEEELGISMPGKAKIQGTVKGSLQNFYTDAQLKTSAGEIRVTGNIKNTEKVAFAGKLKVDSLKLDQLLKNEKLGDLSLTTELEGGGKTINTIDAKFTSDFSQLNYNDYDFSNLLLKGEIVQGKGDVDLKFKDTNLNLTSTTKVQLDSLLSKISTNVEVIGADLQALGLTGENIKAAAKLKANFAGKLDDFKLSASLNDGIAVYEDDQYKMGNIDLTLKIDDLTTNVDIESDFLNGKLESNTSPEGLNTALRQQFQNYFTDQVDSATTTDSVQLKIDMLLSPNPILTEVFFRDIRQLDSISLQAKFNSASKKMNAELHMPLANYAGSVIDSLNILVNGDATDLDFSAGFSKVVLEPVEIGKTFFEGNLKNKELLLDFVSYDGDEKLMHIASEMVLARDTVRLHIDPTELILNKNRWDIPQDNNITIAKNMLEFTNLELSRNAQKLTISNSVQGVDKDHIGINFKDFKLQTFFSLLNPDEALVSGKVQGNLIVENPFGATGIVADFGIDSFKVLENPLGKLTLDATSKSSQSYDFNLSLKDGGADLDLVGDYAAAETGAKLNLNLNLNRLELKVLEGFSEGSINEGKGNISGDLEVSGTTKEPQYNGTLQFNNVGFKVSSLSSVFKISNESLRVDNEGLYLENFTIKDINDHSLSIDGTITTEEITNPAFDLNLVAKEFLLLDSTKEDNELVYGKASFDADVNVGGDLEVPEISGSMRIRKITDVTYVVPESQLDVQERDGVVIFVNRENPDAILTRNDQEQNSSFFKGTDIDAVLEISKDAVFHIIMDERTGDNLKVSGDAELNLNMDPNGRVNLTGRYELDSGHYETSLYNLVNRRFEINPGSTVTWEGDPMNAKLDVTAVYEVETSAAPLMVSVTSGQDAVTAGKFRQVLPFLVYLNVDGELLEPQLSFGLDMPEDEQGFLGGAVYSRVQQLNTQEAELNKQVFSLLALQRFFPDAGSDGSQGGTAAIARDNVNKVLSGELNAFSNRVLGNSGFELDFDLDSFTDYQGETPQDRTQLNINAKKRLFNDRLIVTAGSAVDVEGSAQSDQGQTPIIGNVSLEYLLTRDGNYRLKGFRKNEYQNIIDGQLIVTGVALIFNREFNKFSELFNPLKNNEELEEEKKQDVEKNKENGN